MTFKDVAHFTLFHFNYNLSGFLIYYYMMDDIHINEYLKHDG